MISPSLDQFRQLARDHRVIPVFRKVLADSETPVSLYRKLAEGRPGSFLMESAAEGKVWSRYSFIGVRSRTILTGSGGSASWIDEPPAGLPREGVPVEVLRDTVAALQTPRLPGLPPLTSGMVGYLGWDVVRSWEKLGAPAPDTLGLPELGMALVSDLVVHDNTDGSVWLVANAINHNNTDADVDGAWRDAVERVGRLCLELEKPLPGDVVDYDPSLRAEPDERWPEDRYRHAIDQAKEAIRDGEVFQAVVSRRFELDTGASPLDVYRMLRASNPSPYMYLLTFPDGQGECFSIVGSSPEALVTVKDGRAVTHPIAGSRPRGATPGEDHQLAADLAADPKETSEHLMLVDLARNDLAKVCRPGTVEVRDFMHIERYSHVMHLVSTVTGELALDRTAYDALAATFPAGTLSGAPKPRALRLLDELEPHGRGIYGGVVGYIDFSGDMDMAIAIRTAVLKGGRAYVQAGGGIVADSVHDAEAQESRNKAGAPLDAVARAEGMVRLGTGSRP